MSTAIRTIFKLVHPELMLSKDVIDPTKAFLSKIGKIILGKRCSSLEENLEKILNHFDRDAILNHIKKNQEIYSQYGKVNPKLPSGNHKILLFSSRSLADLLDGKNKRELCPRDQILISSVFDLIVAHIFEEGGNIARNRGNRTMHVEDIAGMLKLK
jgi:hypothetical protein